MDKNRILGNLLVNIFNKIRKSTQSTKNATSHSIIDH